MNKVCSKCSQSKPYSEFYKDPRRKCGLCSICKICDKTRCKEYYINNSEKIKIKNHKYNISDQHKLACKNWTANNLDKHSAKEAKRRAIILKRTPKWADLKAIEQFYLNRPKGYEVDHIIPLQGKNVSGFHVLENLQYLTVSANRRKYNKFEVTT